MGCEEVITFSMTEDEPGDILCALCGGKLVRALWGQDGPEAQDSAVAGDPRAAVLFVPALRYRRMESYRTRRRQQRHGDGVEAIAVGAFRLNRTFALTAQVTVQLSITYRAAVSFFNRAEPLPHP
jgi:hypothetical protein